MRNQELLGDCLELMPLIPDKSVDMVLCDLPYGTTACKWDSIIDLDLLWVQYKRVIKDNGAIVLTASQPFTTKLISSNYKMFKYCWVWNKRYSSNYPLAKKQPMKVHEDIVVFGIGNPYKPIKTIRDSPIKKGANTGASVFNKGLEKEGWQGKEYVDKYPESIILFPNREGSARLHPTQKPVALFEYLIRTYTNEGDLVLDNTAGVFTAAIACLNTNRNYIVMEKEQEYFDKGMNRIKEWHDKKE